MRHQVALARELLMTDQQMHQPTRVVLENQRTKRNEMKESYLSTLLQMRPLVGFLGERAQCIWWSAALY